MTLIQGVVILLGVLAYYGSVSSGNPVTVGPCEGSPPKPNSVDVTPPCPKKPCDFPKGTIVNTTIKFTPKQTMTSGKLEISAKIGPVKIPFPLPNPEACKGHSLECPLKEGVEVALTLSLKVLPKYPSLELVATFDLKDQDDKYVFCCRMPIKIGKSIAKPMDRWNEQNIGVM